MRISHLTASALAGCQSLLASPHKSIWICEDLKCFRLQGLFLLALVSFVISVFLKKRLAADSNGRINTEKNKMHEMLILRPLTVFSVSVCCRSITQNVLFVSYLATFSCQVVVFDHKVKRQAARWNTINLSNSLGFTIVRNGNASAKA